MRAEGCTHRVPAMHSSQWCVPSQAAEEQRFMPMKSNV